MRLHRIPDRDHFDTETRHRRFSANRKIVESDAKSTVVLIVITVVSALAMVYMS